MPETTTQDSAAATAAATAAAAPPRHADAARETASRILDRLADPDATAADAGIPAAAADDGEEVALWLPLSLSSGLPGVSLAFSGSQPRGSEHAARAHAYLSRAMGVLAAESYPPSGIYAGPGAVGFALLVAHRATGGYRTALERLDAYQREVVRAALPAVPDEPARTNGEFETVRGMTGIGRYLLARREACGDELLATLGYLVAMSEGTVGHRAFAGHRVPRWWTYAAPKQGQEVVMPDGHLNLGLSHGVAGPLALLSLAWEAGVVVDGQREAIERLVGLLQDWARPDGEAVRWPPNLTLADWMAGPPAAATSRAAWCYGAPGVSRAIQLAALALDRPDWHDLVRRSLRPFLDTPPEIWGIDDAALCHGWSGVLHLLGLLAPHVPDDLTAVRDDLAARTIAAYRDEHRFGVRSTMTRVPQGADVPAFLEGAAGVAMALDAYASGTVRGDWDMALLVA